MTIHVQRRGNVAATQPGMDIFRVTSTLAQRIDSRMTQIMEADDRKTNLSQPSLKMRSHVIRPYRSSVGMDTDVTTVDIGITKQFLVLCLLTFHLLQIGPHTAGEWKNSVAAVGFCAV